MSLDTIDTMIGFAMVMLIYSLLVTVLVQTIGGLFDLRGRNLERGLARLLEQAAPRLAPQAKQLAEGIVTHGSLATSITKWWPWFRVARAKALRLDELKLVLEEPSLRSQLEKVATTSIAELNEFHRKIETWFDAVMARTSERFTFQARIVAAVAAALVAYGLQVDAVTIARNISSNKVLRARLVAMSPDSVLALGAPERPTPASVVRALESGGDSGLVAVDLPDSLRTRAAARAWLASVVGDSAARADVLRRFDARYQDSLDAWSTRLARSRERIDSVLAEIAPMGKRPSERTDWGVTWGMAMAAVLLSLGAPFWFNLLRSLANLRPLVARMADQPATREKQG